MTFAISTSSLRTPLLRVALAAGLTTPLALGSSPAQAQNANNNKLSDAIAACGNIRVKSDARCKVVVDPPQCKLQCTPLNFQAACSAELQVGCAGQCNADIQVGCQDKCQTACVPQCNLNPGNFSCSAQCSVGCEADCGATCDAKVQASGGGAEAKVRCESSCKAECKATCSGGCQGDLPSLTCEERCGKVCVPECKAKANIDCQIDCQAKGRLDCEARLSGGCDAACSTGKGALFCDGQFINTDELKQGIDSCVGALNKVLTVKVEGYADAECDGQGNCKAEAGVSCDLAPTEKEADRRWLWGLLVLPGAFAWNRRRRAK